MPAFQFPDPAVTQTAENPITGSTYHWREDPGKWVLAKAPATTAGDLIHEGPIPPVGGGFKLWFNTEELELYYLIINEDGDEDGGKKRAKDKEKEKEKEKEKAKKNQKR